MISFFRLLLFSFLMFVVIYASAGETGSEQMERFFANLESFSGNFTQVVSDSEGTVTQEARGNVAIRRPGRFRWHYVDPYEQVILGDGKNIWTYDLDLEQATVKPLSEVVMGTPAMLLSHSQSPQELFHVAPGGMQEGLHWVILQPHDKDMQFNTVRLAFAKGSLEVMELTDFFEQVTRITFHDIERNRPIDDATFKLELAPEIDVIGQPDA